MGALGHARRAAPSYGLEHATGPGGAAAERKATQSLAQELPYLHCGAADGQGPLHLLADDTLGYAFSLTLPVVDTVLEGEECAADAVLAMLHALPPGVQWQWFLQSSADVDDALLAYEQQPGSDPAARLFAGAFAARWRGATQCGFFPEAPELNFYPRRLQVRVALKSAPIGFAKLSLADLAIGPWLRATAPGWLLRRLHARPDQAPNRPISPPPSAAARQIADFTAVIGDLLAACSAHGLVPKPVDADALIDWVGSILFPQRGARPGPRVQTTASAAAPGLDGDELRNAIAALGRIEAIDGAGFRSICGGVVRHHRIASMLWQPRAVASGMLNGLAALLPQLNFSLTASVQSTTAAMLQIKARALLNARSTHRFNETEMQARGEALQEVEGRLFAAGERIVDTRLHVHVVGATAEQAELAVQASCKHLQACEMEAAKEADIGSTLILRACLPFAVYPQTERQLRRRRRLLSRDCADLHPCGGCWTGIWPQPAEAQQAFPSPRVMYSNPLGEPLFIDPTKADKNPHALVIGQSGSGKSFFVHDYLLHLWRLPNVRLFLISIKADYRKLAIVLGRNVEIGLDSGFSLNPFYGKPTRENQAKWFAALELMLTEGRAEQTLTREVQVALQDAAMTAAQRNWDAAQDIGLEETTLEHVCRELERSAGILGRELAAKLHPYRRGPYRGLFNSPRGLTPADRFVFFNLGSILRQPCAALASFCVFGIVDETMNDPALRAVPKGLIADEVWALTKNSHAAAILERSLKAYRSLGGFAVPIVQDPADLDTPGGRVMLVNTATKIVLPLDPAGQADLQRYVRLNERELDIVRNLRLVKRRYSEFFVSIDGMQSVKGLLIPDALRYAIATTDPVDEFLIEQHYQECGDMLTALRRFSQVSPFGVRSDHAAPPPDR